MEREKVIRSAARAAYEACLAVDNETHGERGEQWRELANGNQEEQVRMARALLEGAPRERFAPVFVNTVLAVWNALGDDSDGGPR